MSNKRKDSHPITQITISGYKCFPTPTSIKLMPLTIISGRNSSGKSTFLQPLLLMKQTLESYQEYASLVIDGPNVHSRLARSFIPSTSKSKSTGFSIALTFGKDKKLTHRYSIDRETDAIELDYMRIEAPNTDLKINPRMTRKTIQRVFYNHYIGMGIKKEQASFFARNVELIRDRCTVSAMLHFKTDQQLAQFGYIPAPMSRYITLIKSLIHAPYLRGNLRNTHRPISRSTWYPDSFSGTVNEWAASAIHHWQETRASHIEVLNGWLSQMQLSRGIKVSSVASNDLEIQVTGYQRPSNISTDFYSLNHVGSGVAQALYVLVALVAAEKDNIVYIEEPEAHLHPRAIVELARIIAWVAARKPTVVVETHSEIMLREFQAIAARQEDLLEPPDVSLNWFRSREGTISEVEHGYLDEFGRSGTWPVDFSDISLEVEAGFIKAVSKRKRNNEVK